MDGDNPYQPPEAIEVAASAFRGKWLVLWIFVFVANLLMPVFFAWTVLEDGGGSGVLLGTALLLGISIVVLIQFPRLIRWTRIGGIVVAVSQLFPLLQIVAGSIGIGSAEIVGAARKLTPEEQDFLIAPPLGFAAALVTTLVTGAVLLLVVLAFSLLLMFVFENRDENT